MIRKKRMSKGIAKILSGLLVFGMVAGLVPAVPGGTVHAKAEEISEPGVTVYATKKQLMTAFTPDASGTNANVGKLLFGKNASGTAQGWYILGTDKGVQRDNTIIFAASSIEENVLFNNDKSDKSYKGGYGIYADGNPTEVYANHYGASRLRTTLQNMASNTNYFSVAEQALMQATTVTTTDTKNENKKYTTTDKLYALEGDYKATSLKAGSDNSVLLQRSTYWSGEEFWLRSPDSICPHSGSDAYFTSMSYQNVNGMYVDAGTAIRPAANLDLSNVLFASAATCNDGTINIGEAMTLRLDGKNKGIGTVTYNASTKKIKVDKGNTTDRVYLMVQCKLGGQESLDGCTIYESQDVTMFSDDVDLSKCKIWLETTDADGMIYAVEATEENGGTPAEEHTGIHSIDLPSGETWQGVDSLDKISDAGYYYLTDNVSLTESWTPQNNVVLCLNGKTITMNADNKAVIEVDSNNSFTLCDCKNGGIITHGTKSDGTNKYSGSGVNVNGTFTMYGGSISGNTADQGGGVYNRGTFNMNGGTITSNIAINGGGVYINKGTFNMYGGTITGNKAEKTNGTAYGGGVYINKGTFTMSGGEITKNTATVGGGGVLNDSGQFTMSAGTTISENKAYGGGGVLNDKGTFTMSGGTISRNELVGPDSNLSGGGVFSQGGTFTMSGGTITGNKAKEYGGGVFINTGTFTMSGGEITSNSSESYGGGVWYSSLQLFKMSGTVNITENKVGTTPNNLYLWNGQQVSASGLTSGAEIGVTTQIAPINDSSVPITSDSVSVNCFSSDNSDYETAIDENSKVVLKKKPAVEAPSITKQPQPVSVKVGETATFTVEAAGEGLSYQWMVDKKDNAGFVNIDEATSESYTLNAISKEYNGYRYQCMVSNLSGHVISECVTLTVTEDAAPTPNPNPNPTPEPNPEPTPTPTPNPTPEATTTTPDPAPATTTPAASTTTAPASSVPAPVTYDILDGAGSSWTQNTDGSLAIRGSGEISKFREVKVDGVTVDPVNYTVTEGSTIITFKPEYLKSLSAGNHSFELVWTDGTAATNFTVAENADQSAKSPKTGEDFSMALCTALLMISCAGLAGMFVRRKKSSLR